MFARSGRRILAELDALVASFFAQSLGESSDKRQGGNRRVLPA